MNTWQIKDLIGVGDVQLELDDSKHVFVLFGTNGVGKTKTLELLFIDALSKTNNSFFPPNIKIKIAKEVLINAKKPRLEFQSLDTAYYYINEIKKEYQAIAYLGADNRSVIHNTKKSNNEKNTMSKISEALENDSLQQLGMNNDIHQWFIERAQAVNPYQKEKDNKKIEIDTVLQALHQMDNRIAKNLSVDYNGNVFLTIENQERELHELSSGFIAVVKIIQSIIAYYSDFTNSNDLLNVKGVVLIDEIESHLHLEWQVKIIPTLKKLFPNTIFYIATHSPLVLSQLEEGEAYLLQRDDDGVVRSKMVNSPNKRILANVLRDTFGIDLNQLKRQQKQIVKLDKRSFDVFHYSVAKTQQLDLDSFDGDLTTIDKLYSLIN